jgi:hypothetical protein
MCYGLQLERIHINLEHSCDESICVYVCYILSLQRDFKLLLEEIV